MLLLLNKEHLYIKNYLLLYLLGESSLQKKASSNQLDSVLKCIDLYHVEFLYHLFQIYPYDHLHYQIYHSKSVQKYIRFIL